MPELPEVETVKRGLQKSLRNGARVEAIWSSNKKLRFPFSKKRFSTILHRQVLDVNRRAKYLLFDFGDVVLLNHLGMTGTWRDSAEPILHDHVRLTLSNGRMLTFNDPRRFGYFALSTKADLKQHPFLSHLGPEPLDASTFTAEYLFSALRGKHAPIKNVIMDQRIVVGVGNIYASEALYMSRIKPTRRAGSIKQVEAEALVIAIREVLQKAIQAGGSYIRDFKALEGAASFQHQFQVYDKAGAACVTCGSVITRLVQAGRSTYFCKKCQR